MLLIPFSVIDTHSPKLLIAADECFWFLNVLK